MPTYESSPTVLMSALTTTNGQKIELFMFESLHITVLYYYCANIPEITIVPYNHVSVHAAFYR